MVGITLGDPGGIGIEVTLKAVREFNQDFILFGSRRAIEYYSRQLKIEIPENCSIEDVRGEFRVGEVSPENGEISFESILLAVDAIKKGKCSALVTAPINKKSLHLSGHHWPGHTELLASRLTGGEVVMLMRAGGMNIIFITSHIPLRKVPEELSKDSIIEKVELADREMRKYWHYETLNFGMLGLNPHAGDG